MADSTSASPMDNQDTQTSPKITLGDRMKQYEHQNEQYVDPKLPWIVRLDGHKFSSFTRGFKRPFDDRIHNCMVATCIALLDAFHPTTVFTCSDEITLCFPALEIDPVTDQSDQGSSLNKENASATPENATDDAQESDTVKSGTDNPDKNANNSSNSLTQFKSHMYNGRIQKMATLMSSLASVVFDRTLREQTFDEVKEAKLISYIQSNPPYFDARIFNVPNVHEIVNNLIWRSHYDYRRNSISQLARSFFSPSQMHKLNSHELIDKMIKEKGTNWEDLEPRYKYGSFFKKQKYIKTVELNGKTIEATRSRAIEMSFCFNKSGKEACEFITAKYLEDGEYASSITKLHDAKEKMVKRN